MNRDRESTQIIVYRLSLTAVRRRDVIRETMIELSRRLLHLLTQKIKDGELFSPRLISVEMNVVTDGVCGPKSVNTARDQQIFGGNALKEFLCVIEKFARFFADLWVIKNRRVTAAQFPRMKERRPIDVFDQIAPGDRYFFRAINPHPEKFRFRWDVPIPIDRCSIGTRLLKRQQLLLLCFGRVLPAQALVVFARFFIEVRF